MVNIHCSEKAFREMLEEILYMGRHETFEKCSNDIKIVALAVEHMPNSVLCDSEVADSREELFHSLAWGTENELIEKIINKICEDFSNEVVEDCERGNINAADV